MATISRKTLIVTILITAFCLLFSLLVWYSQLFYGWERQLRDLLFRNFNKEQHPTEAVIVAIDQNSLNFFQQQGILWPWPREMYGIATEYLHSCGARAIVYDIIFDSPDIDRLNSSAELSDSSFARQMQISGRVILAAQMQDSTHFASGFAITQFRHSFHYSVPDNLVREYPRITLPIAQFQCTMAHAGAVNFFTDTDGVCRRLPLLFRYDGRIIPYMALAATLLYANVDSVGFDTQQHALTVGTRQIPIDKDGFFNVYWYGRGGVNGAFKYIAFAQLIQDYLVRMNGETPAINPDIFKDKVVFIGATAAGLLDLKTTPMSTLEPFPGVEVYATIFSNIIRGDYIREASFWVWWLILGVVLALLVFFWQRLKVWQAALITLFIVVIPLLLALVLFQQYKLFFPAILSEVNILLSVLIVLSVNYLTEGREKRLIKKVFNRYLHPAVVETLTKNPEKLEMGGKEIIATVMFTDLQGFTGISELFTPPEIVQFLNQYFEKVAQIVFENNGMLDKYTGDGIMAVFGAPLETDQHALMACEAALGFKKLSALTINAKNQNIPLITRIGINSGNFVVGNIGSSSRMDYTAIGDTVNLSARLEGVNKIYGTQNIISESTYAFVKDHYLCRTLDYIRVKGRDKPLTIYSVIGRRDQVDESTLLLLELHEQALSLYRQNDFKAAAEAFSRLSEHFPTDPVAKVFQKRCFQLQQDANLIDADGVFNITVK